MGFGALKQQSEKQKHIGLPSVYPVGEGKSSSVCQLVSSICLSVSDLVTQFFCLYVFIFNAHIMEVIYTNIITLC